MSKSVLVMDTPENCYECLFGHEWFGDTAHKACCELYCSLRVEEEALISAKYYKQKSKVKPDWCPLKPLPEKMKLTGVYNREYFQSNGKMPSYKIGWNDCIDEITGGSSDD